MKYLVKGFNGPGFFSSDDLRSVLNDVIIPSFRMLIELEKDGVIKGGGVPVGERALVFIIEADSNEELDRHLRKFPMWGLLEWDVIPLQGFEGRMAIEQAVVSQI